MTEQTDSDSEREYSDEYYENQFERRYTDQDFFGAIDECAVATTGNVAEIVDCDRATAFRRLKQLEENGEIGSETVGVQEARVWIVPE